MNASSIPFLCVGLIAGAAVAFFLACTRILTRRMTARGEDFLRRGASESEIGHQLVAEGYDPELSAKVAAKVIHRVELAQATALLELSGSREEACERLTAAGMESDKALDLVGEADLLRWCRKWRVLLAPVGLALFALGVVVCGVGLVLGDAPGLRAIVSKELITFAGAVIISLGSLFLSGAFRKTL
jgi:hypothetical protein